MILFIYKYNTIINKCFFYSIDWFDILMIWYDLIWLARKKKCFDLIDLGDIFFVSDLIWFDLTKCSNDLIWFRFALFWLCPSLVFNIHIKTVAICFRFYKIIWMCTVKYSQTVNRQTFHIFHLKLHLFSIKLVYAPLYGTSHRIVVEVQHRLNLPGGGSD